jgi:tRNA1(Val) A37 N6-methylase TrmN6
MVTAIERDPVAAALAQCSTDLNGMNTQVSIFIGDVTAKNILMQSINRFDHVMINPPYLRISTGTMPPDAGRATAYVESGADLATWIDVAWRLLIPCGRLTLIHRADQLDSICALLIAKQFGAVQVIPLWPKAGHPARRVVVRARREAQSPCVLTPGLVLHEENGKFTLAAQAILRNAGPLGF